MAKNNYRKLSKPFFRWPKIVTNSPEYAALGAHTVKLINDLGSMYIGTNNGDLCATWVLMKKRGWRSPGTLQKAIKQAVDSGFLIITRQGGRNYPSLYAISFFAVDECAGKIDMKPTTRAPDTWRKN